MRRSLLPLILISFLATFFLGAAYADTTRGYIQRTFHAPEIDRLFLGPAGAEFSLAGDRFNLKEQPQAARDLSSLKPQEKMALDALAKKNRTDQKAICSFGKSYDEGYELRKGASVIRVEPAGRGLGAVEDGLLVYKNVGGRMDVVLAPVPGGFEELFLIKSAGRGREAIERKISVNGGEAPRINSKGELVAGGFVLSLPLVIDAKGKKVAGRYSLKEAGRDALLTLSYDSNGLTYPVLIDPTWRAVGAMPEALINQTTTLTLLPNGKVLVAGGQRSEGATINTCQLFDPATGQWTTTGSLISPRDYHTATLLPNGKVLVVGGWSYVTYDMKTCELYDPATGQWTATGSLHAAKGKHTATLLPNGKVLVAGGSAAAPIYETTTCEVYDPATGQWTITGSLSVKRDEHKAVLLPNGKVLVAGGRYSPDGMTAVSVSACEIYDPDSGTWTTGGSLNVINDPDSWYNNSYLQSATMLPTGKILMVEGGNYASNSCELYDPGNNTLAATGNLSQSRVYQATTLLPDGKVLVAGGQGTKVVFGPLTSCELYNPATGVWSAAGNLTTAAPNNSGLDSILMPNGQVLIVGETGGVSEVFDPAPGNWAWTGSFSDARGFHTATLLPSGKVLIAGGWSEQAGALSSCQLYDPATGQWTATGSLIEARIYHTATLLANGKVLVTGGEMAGSYRSSCELYDPATGQWTATNSLSAGRGYHTATLLANGKVLVAGGLTSGASVYQPCQLYDPSTGSWSSAGSLSIGRYVTAAALLPNGKVLVVGGQGGGGGNGRLLSCELYDPAANSWSMTGNLTSDRTNLTATLLPNGKVLAAGGDQTSQYYSTSELYDPATGQWTATGRMNVWQRGEHTATLLPNGKVLVAGGRGSFGGITKCISCEVYDPATGNWAAGPILNTARLWHTATLLPNGKVMAAGGNLNINSCELARYTEYDYAAGGQPAINAVGGGGGFPAYLYRNNYYPISGSGFKSRSDHPRVFVQFADSGEMGCGPAGNLVDLSSSLYPMSVAQWQGADSSLSFKLPVDLPSGFYQLTVQSGGVPSEAKMIYCDQTGLGQYFITSSADSPATITPLGTTLVTAGEDQTFLISIEAGSLVSDVRVDGVSIGPVDSYTFSNVRANHTIKAVVAGSYTVVNCNDSGPGSLRQCLLNANAAGSPVTVSFDIPAADPGRTTEAGASYWRIQPSFALPAVTNPGTVIDAATQTANRGDTNPYGPEVELRGRELMDGLNIQAANCTVKGLVINGCGVGLRVSGEATRIYGNYIGPDATGSLARSNYYNGIYMTSSNNWIGDGTAANRNVISGNNQTGLYLYRSLGNLIKGNYIGCAADGSRELPNNWEGLLLFGSSYNVIGGTGPTDGNLISGNGWQGLSLAVDSNYNLVLGNYIGCDSTGSAAVPNGDEGIIIDWGSSYIMIGDGSAAGANLIAYNALNGVKIDGAYGGSAHVTISRNSIHDNGALGIALWDNANQNVDAPVIATAALSGATGSAPANATVEVFATGTPDGTGAGEGRTFLGSTIANSGGRWEIPLSLAEAAELTATATDRGGNTSQFSLNKTTTIEPLVVINTNTTGPGSLDQCIYNARHMSGDPLTITFNIPFTDPGYTTEAGVGYWSIKVPTEGYVCIGADDVTHAVPVLIDGSSQAVNRGVDSNPYGPEIEINGTGESFLPVFYGNYSYKGLVINRARGPAIDLEGGGSSITGCYFGTDPTGTRILGNGYAIDMSGTNMKIGGSGPGEGNVVAGSQSFDAIFGHGVTTYEITGNYIGTDATGTAALPNERTGIFINGGFSGKITNNLISGNTAGISLVGVSGNEISGNYIGCDLSGSNPLSNSAGVVLYQSPYESGVPNLISNNVISGNDGDGISISDSTDGNRVIGNKIGTNATGTAALANSHGIYIWPNGSVQIGGAAAGEGNLISGNNSSGIYFNSQNANISSVIKGNRIGTNASGTAAIPNYYYGILLNNSSQNIIGGPGAGEGNLISGNNAGGIGCVEQCNRTTIQGNYIGTDVTGLLALPNTSGVGVSGNFEQIGGTAPGEGNLISGNSGAGILVAGGAYDNIEGNYIGCDATGAGALPNGGTGVVLSGTGYARVGPNDPDHGRNIIAFNGGHGVEAGGNTGVSGVLNNYIGHNGGDGVRMSGRDQELFIQTGHLVVSRNTMEANAGVGISIEAGASMPDRPPTIRGARLVNGRTTIVGTAEAGAGIEVFITDANPDPSGGEGKTFLGAMDADPSGNWIMTVEGVVQLNKITATAKLNDSGAEYTSSFGRNELAMPKFVVYHTTDSGWGSLRQCILDNNAEPNHTITFAIPTEEVSYEGGAHFWRIDVPSALPPLTGPVYIWGYSQYWRVPISYLNSYSWPLIYLSGPGSGTVEGLVVQSPGCSIEGMTISGFYNGVTFSGPAANHGSVINCNIGTDPSCEAGLGNFNDGIRLANGANNNLIAVNWISGNGQNGVTLINNGTSHNAIKENYIGLAGGANYPTLSPVMTLGNYNGIFIYDNAADNIIGGTIDNAQTYWNGINFISGNLNEGIDIESVHGVNRIFGNYIGIDITGRVALGNGDAGIYLSDAGMTMIGSTEENGGNVISGNGSGILAFGASDLSIMGNYIGCDAAGTGRVANSLYGIGLFGGSAGSRIGDGTARGRNVISGNGSAGLELSDAGTTRNKVLGNYFGTNAAGSAVMSNGGNNIVLLSQAGANQIGGLNAGEGNLISGAVNDNLRIETDSNEIYANLIGTNAAGTASLGGGGAGIRLWGARYNKIGNGTAAGRNIISGNTTRGIVLDGSYGIVTDSNEVSGNYIGTDITGTQALGNLSEGVLASTVLSSGYQAGASVSGNLIRGNIIANSGLGGVTVRGTNALGNTISRNPIYNSGDLGIVLGDSGNNIYPAPSIEAASVNPATRLALVVGVAEPNASVEIFATGLPDPSGSGEGRTYLGTASAGAGGAWSTLLSGLTGGTTLSATATGTNGNTSQFGPNFRTEAAFIWLDITREADTPGSDILVSWGEDITPDIYVLTGDGSGVYSDNAAGWTKVTNGAPAPGFSVTGKTLRYAGQVGGGTGEAYFKGLKAGSNIALLPSAEAVGKVNVFVATYPPTMELISLPVVPDNGDINSVIGAQFGTGLGEVWSFFNAPTSGWRNQNYNGSVWRGSLPAGALNASRGYWVKSATADVTLTFVGRVPSAPQSIAFNNENLFFVGNSYPRNANWAASGLGGILNPGDQIWQWNGAWSSKNYNGSNSWSGTAVTGLLFKHGFWVKRAPAAATWDFPKPY